MRLQLARDAREPWPIPRGNRSKPVCQSILPPRGSGLTVLPERRWGENTTGGPPELQLDETPTAQRVAMRVVRNRTGYEVDTLDPRFASGLRRPQLQENGGASLVRILAQMKGLLDCVSGSELSNLPLAFGVGLIDAAVSSVEDVIEDRARIVSRSIK